MRGGFVPGDVAVNEHYGYRGIFVSGDMGCHPIHSGGHWHNESGLADSAHDDRRPLVVIDPEDESQVATLALAYAAEKSPEVDVTTAMRAALRSLIDDTKPEEPLGLGAVVEDANGLLWTRVEPGDAFTRNPWYPAADADVQPEEWADIAAVKVLSEGIS